MAAVFRYSHRVIYSECTVGNHVYYARYLDLFEAARGEFFRHAGAPLPELQAAGTIFPVIECRLRYKAPARYDDLLAVEVFVTAMEKVRLNFGCRIVHADGRLLVEGESRHVCTGLDDKNQTAPAGAGAPVGAVAGPRLRPRVLAIRY